MTTTLFERFELAKVEQQVLRHTLETERKQKALARMILAERAEQRRFLLMYQVRHWLHRLAPRMARAML